MKLQIQIMMRPPVTPISGFYNDSVDRHEAQFRYNYQKSVRTMLTDIKSLTATKLNYTSKDAENVSRIVDQMLYPIINDMEQVIEGYKRTLKEQLTKLPRQLKSKMPNVPKTPLAPINKENRSSSQGFERRSRGNSR